jgi:hypothetical protein
MKRFAIIIMIVGGIVCSTRRGSGQGTVYAPLEVFTNGPGQISPLQGGQLLYRTVSGATAEERGDRVSGGSRIVPWSATLTFDFGATPPSLTAMIPNAVLEGEESFPLPFEASTATSSRTARTGFQETIFRISTRQGRSMGLIGNSPRLATAGWCGMEPHIGQAGTIGFSRFLI